MSLRDQTTKETYTQAILAKNECRVELQAAVSDSWKVKDAAKALLDNGAAEVTKCVRMTIKITDTNVQTEYEEAVAKLTFEQTIPIEPHPYADKEGKLQYMRPGVLYSLEEALGFDPIYLDESGQPVEPRITKDGRKMKPNKPGISRKLNQDFVEAYFHADDTPNLEWTDKTLYANIKLEESKDGQFDPKNQVTRFVVTPQSASL